MISILITDAALIVGRNRRSTEEGRALSNTWRRDSVWCPMRGRPYTDTGMGRHIEGSTGNAPTHGCLHSPLLKHICKHRWDKNKRSWTRWLLLNGKLLSWAKPDLSRGPDLLFEGASKAKAIDCPWTLWRRDAAKPPHWTPGVHCGGQRQRSTSDEYGKTKQKENANVGVMNGILNIVLSKQHPQRMEGVALAKFRIRKSTGWKHDLGGWLFLGSPNPSEDHSGRLMTVGLRNNMVYALRCCFPIRRKISCPAVRTICPR